MYNKLIKFISTSIFVYTIIIHNTESSVIRKKDPYETVTNDQGLYNSSDDVVVLNVTNLKNIISNGDTAWLVEFYNSWCGFCQRFAPTWKSLARSVIGWSDIITVAAIDCANDDNNPLCRDYEIMRYPTIRYFSPGDNSHGIDVEKGKDEEPIRQGMIEQLQKDQQNGKGGTWPNIAPYRGNDLKDVWKAVPDTVKYHFFLFENTTSFLGSEVILDLHTVKNLQIRRITRDNQWLCLMYKVVNFPTLIVLDREENQIRLKLSVPTREGTVQVIKDFMQSKGLIAEPEKPVAVEVDNVEKSQNNISNNKRGNSVEESKKDMLYQSDLENALRYSLKREIPLKKLIEGPRFQALKDFLEVISKYFPLKRGNSEFLTKLYDEIKKRTDVMGSDFKKLVLSSEEEMSPVFTEDGGWIGCAGSSPQFRGYPCGLWTLFHTLTVNHAAAFVDEETGSRSVGMILNAMYGYIKYFFGCADCAEHFMGMAKEYKLSEVESVDSTILWLWRAHNQVNLRLAGDATEDPEFPKIQYPSQENCKMCRNSDGSWNEPEILNYLKRKYGYAGIIYGNKDNGGDERVSKPRRDPLSAETYITVQKKTGWDFTIFDISICVVLYVVSAAILVLVCIKFAVKRSSKRKLYIHTLLGRV